jgi:hypothetical protein
MHSSPQSAFVSMTASTGSVETCGKREERVYQAFTIAAILLVLGSLWVF